MRLIKLQLNQDSNWSKVKDRGQGRFDEAQTCSQQTTSSSWSDSFRELNPGGCDSWKILATTRGGAHLGFGSCASNSLPAFP